MSTFTHRNLSQELDKPGIQKMRSGQSYAEDSGHFYRVAPAHFNPKEDLTGWQVQLAIDEQDLEKAWDAICEKVEAHGIPARVAKAGRGVPSGEAISLFIDNNKSRDWQKTLQDIEQTLYDNGITPGKKTGVDIPFEGSAYMGRRNHTNHKGEIIPEAERIHPNPYHGDFMNNIKIEPPRSPAYARLSEMTSTLSTHMGVENDWYMNGGTPEKMETARLNVNDEQQAEQLARVLNEQGISALAGKRREKDGTYTHLVAIPANGFGSVTEEAVFKADKKLQAESVLEGMRNHPDPYLSSKQWEIYEHPEQGASLRVEAPNRQAAAECAQYAAAKTGLSAGTYFAQQREQERQQDRQAQTMA